MRVRVWMRLSRMGMRDRVGWVRRWIAVGIVIIGRRWWWWVGCVGWVRMAKGRVFAEWRRRVKSNRLSEVFVVKMNRFVHKGLVFVAVGFLSV